MGFVLMLMFGLTGLARAADSLSAYAVPLPDGVRAVWDLSQAYRETTPTRERVCLNGLWRWQPAEGGADSVPEGGWGYFKVPGSWPGITDYLQKDSQTVFRHPAWEETRMGSVSAAWYEREFDVPGGWEGRAIRLRLDTLNSHAAVFVDGVRAGEIRFPGGELELTGRCRPGAHCRVSLLVTALPLKGVMLSYTDTAAARETAGSVARRGLCGDVYLESVPRGPRIVEARVGTSVRRGELTVRATVAEVGLGPGPMRLHATVRMRSGEGRDFVSPSFGASDLDAMGGLAFTERWMPAALWDLDTPGNTGELQLELLDANGRVVDVFDAGRFGFREFWIDGRDFYLNGTRVLLSAVPLDNAQVGAAWANYAAARESLERLKGFGINFVYGHNYGCEPGAHLAFEAILRAADDVGILVALSQPHFSHYEWRSADADRTNGYADHAAAYVGAAGNHPAVVMYAMSHNATGYNEDMNPDLIDGRQDARDEWAQRNVRMARRAEAMVSGLDPERLVYHHASGNLGPMHAVNFYPNFAPIQELSDWFEHWATDGVKPLFLCEYGAPFSWDWTMYRGWYRGQREFGSARVPWEFCLAEWNAQFLGDAAYPASEAEKRNLRWEARKVRAGEVWHRWDYPSPVGSPRFSERYPVFAAYLTDNWRAFRTWGVSAISPWEYGHFWRVRDGVARGRKELPVDWGNLQRPGFSPDFVDERYERMDLAFDRSDWEVTPAAEALLRNNRPLLAWIAGPPGQFTAKDHHFQAGEVVEKQFILLNASRRSVTCEVRWTLDLPRPVSGQATADIGPGAQERLPGRWVLPVDLPPGRYVMRARFAFSGGEVQEDEQVIHVLSEPSRPAALPALGLFDPVGETRDWLERIGVSPTVVGSGPVPDEVGVLIVGKGALSADGPAPDIRRVREGLRVVLFEQTAEALSSRLGFRVAEYGLRQVFPRVPDHPLLAGLRAEHLAQWRGEATLLAPRLSYQSRPRYGPTVSWCGLPVTRLWRCGNRGNVASVLIEKPARGDFLPLVDGGFSLQYSPLLEYREGRGLVLFCQLDVTGRTAADPVAETMARRLLRYAVDWQPPPGRAVVYLGEEAGWAHLKSLGIPMGRHNGGLPHEGSLLVLGPGARTPGSDSEAARLQDWIRTGGPVLALGLGTGDLRAFPGLQARAAEGEHISVGLEPQGWASPFAGLSAADLHNRDPRTISLIAGGAKVIAGGVLAADGGTVYCQVVPWRFDGELANLRRTHRRVAFAVSRLLGNLGVRGTTPLLERFHEPPGEGADRERWREGLYLDQPVEWDDPYRFFRW